MTDSDSSMIERYDYRADKRVLIIEFRKNHQVWEYYGVPPLLFSGLEGAESAGAYFLSEIRGHYPERRLR